LSAAVNITDADNGNHVIGAADNNSNHLDGRISELRVSHSIRSDSWIDATHETMKDNMINYSFDNIPATPGTNWLDGFRYRKEFIIDHRKINSNLTDFPLTIHLNDTAGIASEDVTDLFSRLKDNRFVNFTGDDFTGSNGEAPDANVWYDEPDAPFTPNLITINSNALYFNSATSGNVISAITSKFQLRGDFDIQIDYQAISITSTSLLHYYPYFAVNSISSGANLAYVTAAWYSDSRHTSGGQDAAYASTNPAYNSGKLRITRVSGEVKVYVWTGTQWEWGGNTAGRIVTNSNTDDVEVNIRFEEETGGSVEASADNFVINSSDSVLYKSEFLDELANVKRKRIAVTTDDGKTQCYVEIENFDSINQQATLHTKIPSISSTQDTKIYLYFDSIADDNTTYVGDTGGTVAQNVWDSNFVQVLHMNQDPSGGSGAMKDSTLNGNNGTTEGAMTSDDLIDSLVGKSIDLDGNDDAVQIPNFSMGTGMTLEALANIDDALRCVILLQGNGINIADWWLGTGGANQLVFGLKNTTQQTIGSATINTGNNYLAGTFDGTDLRAYNNGTLDSGPTTRTVSPAGTGSARIGYWNGFTSYGEYADMKIDEVRISNTGRSSAWIKATYHSLFNRIFRYIGYTKTR
jgi:hypothetical protein